MIHLAPLGTGIILPAFVVGYELPLPRGSPDRLQGLPPWMVTVDQQAGGLAMSYPSVVGAVLRVEANADRVRKDPDHLVRGFRLMAEDPDLSALQREYPVLAGLVLTHGGEYTKRQLRDLENVLSAHFSVPPLRGGIEAFLRHEPCDPLDYFRGWKALRCAVRTGPLRGSVYALPELAGYHVEESNLSDLDLADDVVYDEDRQRELVALMGPLGAPGEPGVFFLWENSD